MKKKRRKLLCELCSDPTLPRDLRLAIAKHLVMTNLTLEEISSFSDAELDEAAKAVLTEWNKGERHGKRNPNARGIQS